MVYLIAASLVAAVLQVFLPRTQLVTLGQGPLLSVLIMMLIAVVWFFGGLLVDIIFFYPPILFVIGLVAFIKGCMGGD